MNLSFKLIIKIALFLSVMFFISCKKKQKEITDKSTYAVKSNLIGDLCKNNWFPHSETKNPLEGRNSPFAKSTSTNAIFHQWSWQKFLWLTKPTYEIEKLKINVNGKEQPLYIGEKLPLFLNPKRLTQVSSHMDVVSQKEGASVVLKYIHQAGSSGILTTNPDYSIHKKSDTIFYSIHVDPILKNAAEKFKDSILNKTLGKDNLSSFPVGSLELKVSWVAKSAIVKDKQKDYFTTVAAITKDGITYKNTEVALLGMHVVGVVENHPEFIWATFEHDDLAPNYDWKQNKANTLADKLLFKKGATQGIDAIKVDTITKQVKEKYKVFDLFKYGVPRNKGGDFMITSQNEPVNFDNIQNINSCVKENLKDVWKNYFYNGSIWIDTDGLTKKEQAKLLVKLNDTIGNGTLGSYTRGSLNCANVTMETFTQTFKNDIDKVNVKTLANCFSCHNAVSYTNDNSPIYMSHLFDAFIKKAEGKTATQIEKIKVKQEVLEFVKFNLK